MQLYSSQWEISCKSCFIYSSDRSTISSICLKCTRGISSLSEQHVFRDTEIFLFPKSTRPVGLTALGERWRENYKNSEVLLFWSTFILRDLGTTLWISFLPVHECQFAETKVKEGFGTVSNPKRRDRSVGGFLLVFRVQRSRWFMLCRILDITLEGRSFD